MNVMPIILISILLPIVLVVVILGTLMKRQAATDQLLKTGMPARGRILQLGTTGGSVAVMGHRHLKLILTVEVQPSAGAPYTATFEQLISELQIPSVQPGANVELRIDPANPMRIALAGVIPPGQEQMGIGGFRQPGAYGHPQMAMGVMQPNYRSSLPFIIMMMVITTVPIGAIMIYVFGFGGFGSFGPTSVPAPPDVKKSGGTSDKCQAALKCCKVVFSGGGNCEDTMKDFNDLQCETALGGYKQSAKSMKKTCD